MRVSVDQYIGKTPNFDIFGSVEIFKLLNCLKSTIKNVIILMLLDSFFSTLIFFTT